MSTIYNNITNSVAGFKPRKGQSLMVKAINQDLTNRVISCIEAPCGIGKSLAYTSSTIPLALKKNQKVIISTATVALQSQILEKELPFLIKHGNIKFNFALAKGRSRFLCMQKFVEATKSPKGDDALLSQIHKHLKQGWKGDVDEIPNTPDKVFWARVHCDSHSCIRQACKYFDDCAFYRAKAKIDDSDVIVANHDLVLADLKLGGGKILPEIENSVYVFDEAHHLVNKAKQQFCYSFRATEIVNSLTALNRACQKFGLTTNKNHKEKITLLVDASKGFSELGQRLQTALESTTPQTFKEVNGVDIWRFSNGTLPPRFAGAVAEMVGACQIVLNHGVTLFDAVKDEVELDKKNHTEYTDFVSVFSRALADLDRIHFTLKGFHASQVSSETPRALWVELYAGNNINFRLVSSPIDVSKQLNHFLWKRCAGAVLTSATLTTQGNFDHLMKTSGLIFNKKIRHLKLEPHFDYQKKGQLIIPQLTADPRNVEQHTQEVIDLLPYIVSNKAGSLVLFASRLQMEEVYSRLDDITKRKILMQGTLPKVDLLNQHKSIINSGRSSILFGLSGFGEGIDLPGKFCESVIIAKLPFSVPVSPVEQATHEWLRTHGKNPFREVTLPETIIHLTQQVGRLLRTETDAGHVFILDKRLITKGYGKDILKSLPPFSLSMNKNCTIKNADDLFNTAAA